MFAVKKWIVPVAALAMLAGFSPMTRAQEAAPMGKATITVTVVDAEAKPVEGATVMLTTGPAKGPKANAAGDTPDPATGKHTRAKHVAEGKTDKDGKAVLPNIADGTYMVAARLKGAGAGRDKVTVTDGKDASVTVTLKAHKGKHGGAAAATPAPAN